MSAEASKDTGKGQEIITPFSIGSKLGTSEEGFLDNLRGQIKTGAQAMKDLDEKDPLRRETEEREYHLQRKSQAIALRRDSGVGILVRKLGEILEVDEVTFKKTDGSVGTRSRGSSTGPDNLYMSGSLTTGGLSYGYPDISLTDQDSTLERAIWDLERHERGDFWDTKLKFLGVETRPDGNIVFHTQVKSQTEIILEQAWRRNPNILEEALEKAFNNPGTNTHSFRFRPAIAPVIRSMQDVHTGLWWYKPGPWPRIEH